MDVSGALSEAEGLDEGGDPEAGGLEEERVGADPGPAQGGGGNRRRDRVRNHHTTVAYKEALRAWGWGIDAALKQFLWVVRQFWWVRGSLNPLIERRTTSTQTDPLGPFDVPSSPRVLSL